LHPDPKKVFGRPTVYTEDWLKEEGDALLEWIKKDEGIYLGTFAYERGYARTRLIEFAQKSEYFSYALDIAKTWQENKFVKNALLKQWDATFARYCMARVCGDLWKASYDKEESDRDVSLNISINKIEK
jgi:hypothetical protein